MKKLVLLGSVQNPLILSVAAFFKDKDVEITFSPDTNLHGKFDLVALFDYKENLPDELLQKYTVVNIHPSLLPAFPSANPIKQAFMEGVKVSGVTVYYVTKNAKYNIIAQFPVLIDYNTHYDEFEENIIKTEKMLYPIVIKSVLEDKAFNFSDIMAPQQCFRGCNGSCHGC